MITKQTIDLNSAAPDGVVVIDQPVVPASVSTRKHRGGRPAATQTEAGAEQQTASGAAHGDGIMTSHPVKTGRAEAIAADLNTASTADAGSDSQVKVGETASGVPSRKNKKVPSGIGTASATNVTKAGTANKVSTDRRTNAATRKGGAGARHGSKTELVLNKLRLARGASIEQLAEVTGWQAHSVRGFLSAVVRKKMSLNLTSETGKDGVRRYRIADGPVN